MVKFIIEEIEITAKLGLELYQVDIKTAFLKRKLKQEIYMEQPWAPRSQVKDSVKVAQVIV